MPEKAIVIQMPQAKPPRTWRAIARELANERVRERVIELHNELDIAMGEQYYGRPGPKHPGPTI